MASSEIHPSAQPSASPANYHNVVQPLHSWSRGILAFLLAALTLTVYAPVKHHPFIHIDDYGYVANNLHIQHLNWETVTWSFTTFHYSNWDPLTWLSHALDWHFFGADAGGHHETSLLLHALNAVLLFWMLTQATGNIGRSFAVAVIFALHPVNVEPVAWVAERKTVLSMSFFLVTLIAYRWYARRPIVACMNSKVRWSWTGVLRYLVVALLFACGLMSKPQVITLPLILLLWDYWPLGRLKFRNSLFALGQKSGTASLGETTLPKDVQLPSADWRMVNGGQPFHWLLLEKVPLLALSVASAFMTMKAQWVNRTLGGLNTYPFSVRLSGSILGYLRYLSHALWPANLSFFYPHAHSSPPVWQTVLAALVLLLITWLALAGSGILGHSRWALGRRGDRNYGYLAVGWFWFLGTLVPMIQLVQVGNHGMADRYSYLPAIGLFIAICWGVADTAGQWPTAKVLLPAATVVIVLVLAVATRRQLSYWTDDLTLWTHSAEAVHNNAMAEEMIGEALLQRHDRDTALAHFRVAATMDPLFPYPYLHIGTYEEDHGHPREALVQFQRVIDLTQSAPDAMSTLRTSAFAHMSFAYNQLGDYANQQKYVDLAAQQRRP